MNKSKLYKAIGAIEEELIMEAKDATKKVKKMSFRKTVLVAIAATMALVTVGFAGNIMVKSTMTTSSSMPSYTSLPSVEQIKKDTGMEVTLLDEFENGYKFKQSHIGDGQHQDEKGNTVEKFSNLMTYYEKGEKSFYVTTENAIGGMEDASTVSETYKNIDLRYFKSTIKMVPPDYVMTEEDKALQESGEVEFSVGTEEVEVLEVQGLGWKQNELNFSIGGSDLEFNEKDLVEMAKQMIDAQ